MICLNQIGFSQNINVSTIADTNSMLIGEQFNLQIQVSAPKDGEIIWPVFKDTLDNNFDIIHQSNIDTLITSNTNLRTLSQELTLTSFDTGNLVTPSIPVKFKAKGDSVTIEANSNQNPIYVGSVPVDTAQKFKGIASPIHQPITIRMVLPYFFGLVILAVLLVALIVYLKRRKENRPFIHTKPEVIIPPQEIALNKLGQLRLDKVWQQGEIKLYYSRLTDIIREYIEGQFSLQALEMTSDEIMSALKALNINDLALQKLNGTLMLADLVKFAKEIPSAVENDSCLENLIDFVNETPVTKTDPITDTDNPLKPSNN